MRVKYTEFPHNTHRYTDKIYQCIDDAKKERIHRHLKHARKLVVSDVQDGEQAETTRI